MTKAPVVRVLRADSAVVCEHCAVAATFVTRLKGLLGHKGLDPGEGLLIRPASSIHMFFMRFPIDAVFLDRELVVRKVVADLKPWRITFALGAKSVIELPSGEAERRGVAVGERLAFEESP